MTERVVDPHRLAGAMDDLRDHLGCDDRSTLADGSAGGDDTEQPDGGNGDQQLRHGHPCSSGDYEGQEQYYRASTHRTRPESPGSGTTEPQGRAALNERAPS